MKTALLEIQRIGNVYGEGELETREKQVKLTMRGIKHVLTERWYTWENARVAAMEDEEVDLYADIDNGQSAYLPKSEAVSVTQSPCLEAHLLTNYRVNCLLL